jgi:hypothetical protein
MIEIFGFTKKSGRRGAHNNTRATGPDRRSKPSTARVGLALLATAIATIALAGCGDLEDENARRNAGPPVSMLEREQRAQRQGADLRNVGYNLGNPAAPVAVVEFSDFGCQFCGQFARESFPTLRREFIDTGKVQWKYIPYVLGIFPNGDRAAIAGECAAEQGEKAFWDMHDILYERQREWKSEGGAARALFTRYAAELNLDQNRFTSCYDTNRPATDITRNLRLGQQLGVRATPTFFINGARVEGAIPLDLFRRVLQEAGEQ